MAATERPSTPRLGGGRTQIQASASSRQTITSTTTAPQQAVLRLRGAVGEAVQADGPADGEGISTRRRVQWAEDVVNNEGLGRKKSKVCCIYHAPKGIDESSDESSSDSDDSDSGDDGSARPTRRVGKGNGPQDHNHAHDHDHQHGHDHAKGKSRRRSPNAYEKMPKPKHGGPAR